MSTLYQFAVAKAEALDETWTNAADLGVENITRSRLHAGIDSLTIKVCGKTALTDEPAWAYNTLLRLRRVDSGVPTLLFLGSVQPIARGAIDSAEAGTITVLGIWKFFERTTMRQAWLEADDTAVYAPHVVLFADGSGSRITTGAQITQALQCAIDSGCPISIGDIPTGYAPPYDEQINISVADVLVKCLANHPHSVLWADYSTRLPTVHVATRQSLTPYTATLTSGQAEHLTITSREDLQPPAVAIAYIRTNQDGDRTYIQTTIDHAPVIPAETAPDLQSRLYANDVLWGTFDLQGSSAQYIEQAVTVEPVGWADNKSSAAWWKARVPGIADANVTAISNPSGTTNHPHFLVSGAIAEWMDVSYANETFTADATLTRSNAQGVVESKIEKISFTAVTTDATSKTYKKRIAYDSGETPPVGLAADMWAEWDQLHYDGQLTLTDSEFPSGIGPGMTLNILAGRTEWETMRAMIIQVTEDMSSGSATIQFGVPAWIDLDSRMAWIRNCRTRRFAWSRNMQGGTSPDSGADGPIAMPNSSDGCQPTVWLRQRFIDPSADVKHEVDINLSDIDDETKRTLKLREVIIPYDDSGTTKAKKAIALVSEGYGDVIPIGGTRPADPADPTTLGQNSEGDSDAAVTTAYTATASDAPGLAIWVCSRLRYDHSAGTPHLYAYMSKLTFPAAIAPTVTGQTRVEIDAPEL